VPYRCDPTTDVRRLIDFVGQKAGGMSSDG
jgi:hypothetical protein